MIRFRALLAASTCVAVAALFSCVGEDPGVISPTGDGGTGGTDAPTGTSNDSGVQPETSTTCDPCEVGVDAGPRKPVAAVWSAGLIAYWPFDGDALDYGPKRLDLTLSGTSFAAGIAGQGINRSLSSTVKRAVVDADLAFGTGAFTIQLWLYETQIGFHTFLNRTEPSVDAGWYVFQQDPSPNDDAALVVLGLGAVKDQIVALQTSTTKAHSKWRQLILTRGSDGTATIYVDGISRHQVPLGDIAVASGAVFRVGESVTDPSRNFVGTIDEVAIWSQALSASDIASLYNNGQGKTLFAP